MKQLMVCTAVLLVAAVAVQQSHGQVLVAEFSEQTIPTNPQNGYGSFTFGDLSVSGAVTDGPDSLIFDVQTDNDGSNGFFGGIGVDFGPQVELVPGSGVFVLDPLDFDPAVSWWEMRVKLLPDNAASLINTVYRDVDVLGQTAEEYQFNFDLTSIPDDGQFHTITVPATNWGFMQNSQGVGDGENNPGLNQIQIQSVFGSSDRLNVEVDYARIYTVPEPTSVMLLGLASVALIALRRR